MALPDGTPTNAVYGYCSMLLKLIEEKLRNNIPDEQEIISVIFDSARKNFRNDIYPEYKANRGDIPLELIPQFSLIRQATAAFGLPVIELNMYEADDIIATYVRQISAQNDACRIVSSDKDLMQLIDDDKNIFIYDAMKDKNLYACDAMKKFSVLPHQIPDVQALIGDTSDNIPGVLGIGPKGAADLINEFQNIENMYDNIDCVKSEKHRVMLTANKENALISKRLATLKNDIDMHINICDFSPTIIDFDSLIDFCKSMNFPSIVNRVLKLKNLQSIK
jgi:DNA polymerase-1